MHGTETARNYVSLIIGLLIAAGAMIATAEEVSGAPGDEMSITGPTNASEAIRQSRFRFLDRNSDGYISRDEVPESDPTLVSMYDSLDENDDGRLSEPEYVLNGRAR